MQRMNRMNSKAIQHTAIAVCPFDCPDTCGLSVTLEDGRITTITGDKEHPVTQGAICNKVRQLADRVYHPERLLYPMKRTGAKGTLSFERISWEEVYELLVGRMNEVIEAYGAEAT
jgi:anaerobic selenocysteine-containing dehydrogenase